MALLGERWQGVGNGGVSGVRGESLSQCQEKRARSGWLGVVVVVVVVALAAAAAATTYPLTGG